MNITGVDSALLREDIATLEGIDNARVIAFACLIWLFYEYSLTVDQEVRTNCLSFSVSLRPQVKFFWSGRWTPSRVLYLFVRGSRCVVDHAWLSYVLRIVISQYSS